MKHLLQSCPITAANFIGYWSGFYLCPHPAVFPLSHPKFFLNVALFWAVMHFCFDFPDTIWGGRGVTQGLSERVGGPQRCLAALPCAQERAVEGPPGRDPAAFRAAVEQVVQLSLLPLELARSGPALLSPPPPTLALLCLGGWGGGLCDRCPAWGWPARPPSTPPSWSPPPSYLLRSVLCMGCCLTAAR